jgi:hypothetical protein
VRAAAAPAAETALCDEAAAVAMAARESHLRSQNHLGGVVRGDSARVGLVGGVTVQGVDLDLSSLAWS